MLHSFGPQHFLLTSYCSLHLVGHVPLFYSMAFSAHIILFTAPLAMSPVIGILEVWCALVQCSVLVPLQQLLFDVQQLVFSVQQLLYIKQQLLQGDQYRAFHQCIAECVCMRTTCAMCCLLYSGWLMGFCHALGHCSVMAPLLQLLFDVQQPFVYVQQLLRDVQQLLFDVQ